MGATSLGQQKEKITQIEIRMGKWEQIRDQVNQIDKSQGVISEQVKNLDERIQDGQENLTVLLRSIQTDLQSKLNRKDDRVRALEEEHKSFRNRYERNYINP